LFALSLLCELRAADAVQRVFRDGRAHRSLRLKAAEFLVSSRLVPLGPDFSKTLLELATPRKPSPVHSVRFVDAEPPTLGREERMVLEQKAAEMQADALERVRPAQEVWKRLTKGNKRFQGKFVAVCGEKVIAVASTERKAFHLATERSGGRHFFVGQVNGGEPERDSGPSQSSSVPPLPGKDIFRVLDTSQGAYHPQDLRPYITASVIRGKKKFPAEFLIDTGANISMISQELFDEISESGPVYPAFWTPVGSLSDTSYNAERRNVFNFDIELDTHVNRDVECIVGETCILGTSMLREYRTLVYGNANVAEMTHCLPIHMRAATPTPPTPFDPNRNRRNTF